MGERCERRGCTNRELLDARQSRVTEPDVLRPGGVSD